MSIFDIFNQISKEKEAPVGAKPEYLIVGLGNIGEKYDGTRHNAGFMAIDKLAEKCGVQIKKLRFKSNTADAVVNGVPCLLMKPTTFMNNSGEAVREAMNFYKMTPDQLLVLSDDIALNPGVIRVRKKGSDGGQKGLRSIIQCLGEDTFPRVRIGVGAKPHPAYDLADWVLSKFKKDEQPLMEDAFEKAAGAAKEIIGVSVESAMNKFSHLLVAVFNAA